MVNVVIYTICFYARFSVHNQKANILAINNGSASFRSSSMVF